MADNLIVVAPNLSVVITFTSMHDRLGHKQMDNIHTIDGYLFVHNRLVAVGCMGQIRGLNPSTRKVTDLRKNFCFTRLWILLQNEKTDYTLAVGRWSGKGGKTYFHQSKQIYVQCIIVYIVKFKVSHK